MARDLRRHLRQASGQALILVVLGMPVFLGLTAVVVDGTRLMIEKRALQNASDAAALAGAQELPVSGVCDGTCLNKVRTKIQEYSAKNGGPSVLDGGTYPGDPSRCGPATDTNCFKTPYGGNDRLVEVRLHHDVDMFFTKAVKLAASFGVSARAVSGVAGQTATSTTPGRTDPGFVQPSITQTGATHTTTDPDQVVGGQSGVAFAKSTACPAISYLGAGGAYIGALETNGGFTMGGSGAKVVDYLGVGRKGDAGCYDVQSGAVNHVYGPFAPLDWPLQPPAVPTPPTGCTSLNPQATVKTKALSNNVVTLTTQNNHGFSSGETVVVAVGDVRFDGTFAITAASGKTFSYAAPAVTLNVANKSISGGAVTLTTTAAHTLKSGDDVTVAIGDPRFDGSFKLSGTTSTTLKYTPATFTTTAWSVSGTTATLTTAAPEGLNVGDHVTISAFSGPRGFLNATNVAVTAVTGTSFSYTVASGHTGTSGNQAGTVKLVSVASASSGGTVSVVRSDVGSTAASGTATVTSRDVTISGSWASSNPPGVYCLTGNTATLYISNIDLSGGAGYTFFAPYLDIAGGSYKNYSPQPAGDPPTLFYASKDIMVHGSSAAITGDIFAPNGNVSFTGTGVSAGSGFIESQTLSIAGSLASFHGTGPNVGGQVIPGAVHTTTDASTVISGWTSVGTTIDGTTMTVMTGTTYDLVQ